jgi:hypothetical protein
MQSPRDLAQALGASADEHLARPATVKLESDPTAGIAARAIDGDLWLWFPVHLVKSRWEASLLFDSMGALDVTADSATSGTK